MNQIILGKGGKGQNGAVGPSANGWIKKGRRVMAVFTMHNPKDDIELEKDQNLNDIQELKRLLTGMKSIEKQAVDLISKLENKK